MLSFGRWALWIENNSVSSSASNYSSCPLTTASILGVQMLIDFNVIASRAGDHHAIFFMFSSHAISGDFLDDR